MFPNRAPLDCPAYCNAAGASQPFSGSRRVVTALRLTLFTGCHKAAAGPHAAEQRNMPRLNVNKSAPPIQHLGAHRDCTGAEPCQTFP